MEKLDAIKSKWAECISTGNLEGVLSLYDSSALLKPTLAPDVRNGIDNIKPYFSGSEATGDAGFLNQGIVKTQFNDSVTREYADTIVDIGHYTFTKKDGSSVYADYTLIFKEFDGELKIVLQHSSLNVNN